ncbi:hypothetical protein ANME2D_03297 [Candidatus Methanoperedens nitroreducens]|uniref:Uncharacterized protein n=1 Tax=Candidatus Methanoperedens nitratireducens TaxID=1392998 RepID=A0A062UYZ5_9EURY|nr:DUF6448 family protein [Candidatus Methanoperedens nitroreducens]KCZ70382.1 hypothetical protein ANME2D_03297 [Candidatus Methanoperedens nitroreducens]MDJ1420822.1 DUF6448 family protein [Candidatus Methanoperedens sp.]
MMGKVNIIITKKIIAATALVILFAIAGADVASAHCDTMDGPVIKAAQNALETGNVNPVLIWIQKEDEDEIKEAFRKTLEVRKLSPEARNLADMYFFETLVRIHRAGEGAPYTGLKPAGAVEPVILAADRALENGSDEQLLKLLTHNMQNGVNKQFKDVMDKKNYDPNNVDAGREYAEAYVEFTHYVEQLYETAKSPSDHSIETESQQNTTQPQVKVGDRPEVNLIKEGIDRLKEQLTMAWRWSTSWH